MSRNLSTLSKDKSSWLLPIGCKDRFFDKSPAPEVAFRATKRRIGDPDKQRILGEVDQARGIGKINEIHRREGIYSSQETQWRKKFANIGKGATPWARN